MNLIGPVRHCGKYGFLTESGHFCIPPIYEALGEFREGAASFLASGKIGFLDRNGGVVISPRFEPERFEMPHFSEGRSAVRHEGRLGYIDHSGDWVVRPSFDRAWDFREGKAIVEMFAPDQGYYLINLEGRLTTALQAWEVPGYQDWPADWDCFPVQEKVSDRLLVRWIDYHGSTIFPPRYAWMTNWENGVAGFCIDDDSVGSPWGLTLLSGEVTIQPQFWELSDFCGGLARARHCKGRTGYVNTAGEWVIEPKFPKAAPFSEGLACVHVEGKTGFIDTAGKIAIEPKFSGEANFEGGYAQLILGGRDVVIDKAGKLVWQAA